MKYHSDQSGPQLAIVGEDGRAVAFIPYLHPDSEKIKTSILTALNNEVPKVPEWYDAKELRMWLKSKNYSDIIADEICADYAKNLQLAYEKGMSRQIMDVRDIHVVDPETNVQNNVKVGVQQYISKCNYSLTYENVLYYYNEYYLKGERVSHTVSDVIKNALLPAFGAYFNANKSE